MSSFILILSHCLCVFNGLTENYRVLYVRTGQRAGFQLSFYYQKLTGIILLSAGVVEISIANE